MLTYLANPARFMAFSAWAAPLFFGLAVIAFAVGLPWALAFSPADYQQGETVRIMYVHVPAAWWSMGVYAFMGVASFVGLVWRHSLADVAARAAAPIGATFAAVCLVTGSLWGAPTWGTWWEWDGRLTSMLALFIIYLGYIALWSAMDDEEKAARLAAILCLVGLINLPIIKFSVDWWSTLHQPASIMRSGGSAIHPSMLGPLLTMAGAYLALFAALLMMNMRAAIFRRRVEAARMRGGEA
ncbi:heme ABC transporter permease [Terricaulis sp.]|jgi:heme exporter protein C|uniref:heme ABC transporter permease n=1 Tax=Terricaulis sp. TaxID=2768686 RepID=UPI002AC67D6E|nr:heme ABC transporter permease [Terricaulis sp.]MDZ4689977.1 heme ABC transporter permease [Terricaulis sp.]